MILHVYLQLHMHTRIYPYTHIIDDFMWHPCRPSKVSCRDIRQARVTRNPSKGLKKLTKISLRKSEVGSHKVFRDHGASLDVKDFKGWPCQQIWIRVREVWRLAEIPRWIWPPPVLGWNQWLGSHEEWWAFFGPGFRNHTQTTACLMPTNLELLRTMVWLFQ